MWAVILLLAALFSCPADAAELQAKHLYAPGHKGTGTVASLVGNFVCPGGCHLFDGEMATVISCKWASLEGRTVHLEETAGWLVVWGDKDFEVPILPSEEEYHQLHDEGQHGYLKGAQAITLEVL
eukprot:Sspe_Gene.101018::Locus_75647_Transcript_1_1_Confidence_1.000_Length_731::g.101018::m.101018